MKVELDLDTLPTAAAVCLAKVHAADDVSLSTALTVRTLQTGATVQAAGLAGAVGFNLTSGGLAVCRTYPDGKVESLALIPWLTVEAADAESSATGTTKT